MPVWVCGFESRLRHAGLRDCFVFPLLASPNYGLAGAMTEICSARHCEAVRQPTEDCGLPDISQAGNLVRLKMKRTENLG